MPRCNRMGGTGLYNVAAWVQLDPQCTPRQERLTVRRPLRKVPTRGGDPPTDGQERVRRASSFRGLGLEALAHAVRHRRRRAVHARRSRPGVSDRREPGSAEKEREPKRVHRLIVPATRRATGASGVLFSDSLLMHPDPLRGGSTTGRANPTRNPLGQVRPQIRPQQKERPRKGLSRSRSAGFRHGRYWARTSDPQLVELVLSQLS